MKFIHLTDLHVCVGTQEKPLARAVEQTRAAIAEINRMHSDAELCVITGDIVADPDPAAYRLAEELLSTLRMPTYCLLGNHDDRDMAGHALSTVSMDENGFLQSAIRTSQGLFLTLDTKAGVGHGGELCLRRLNWIADRLAANPGPVRVFMHHAPFATGLAAMDTIGLEAKSAEALGQLFDAHGNIQHLFFGHYHRPMSRVWRGVPFSSHRSMMLQCALNLSELELVSAIYEEPQFAVVLAHKDRTIVHYHDFAAAVEGANMGPASG